MEEAIAVFMDEDCLNFTEDGRVSVVDALSLVLDSDSAPDLWEKMKAEHPDILAHCEERIFRDQGAVFVIDKEGWEKIWMLLSKHLFSMALAH
jgi:hypothetical protein